MNKILYVVCVNENQSHTTSSVLRKCDICFENVWCSDHNLLKTPICMQCTLKLPDPKFILSNQDMQAAIEAIKKGNIVNGTN